MNRLNKFLPGVVLNKWLNIKKMNQKYYHYVWSDYLNYKMIA